MIPPTIGRVVLVYRGERHEGTQWNTAQICYVHSETEINVAGFTKEGEPFSEHYITLRQDPIAVSAVEIPPEILSSDLDDKPFACWMPYQRAAAGRRGET